MSKQTSDDSPAELRRTLQRIGIAADHGGYELKEYLAGKLRAAGYEVVDFGDGRPKEDDDYPDFIVPLARAVAGGEVDRGAASPPPGEGNGTRKHADEENIMKTNPLAGKPAPSGMLVAVSRLITAFWVKIIALVVLGICFVSCAKNAIRLRWQNTRQVLSDAGRARLALRKRL